LLKVASSSYLISISRRKQVAEIRGKPIYTISEVALIPLSSQSDAEKAIVRARESQGRHNEQNDEEDSSSDSEYDHNSEDERDDVSFTDESLPSSPPSEPNNDGKTSPHKRATSIAQDVIQQKGVYGRFTQKWFSKGGWKSDGRRNQGMPSEDDLSKISTKEQLAAVNPAPSESQEQIRAEPEEANKDDNQASLANEPPKELEQAVERNPETDSIPLLPKLLTVTKLFFGSRNFYFSYDYDISKSVANQPKSSPSNPLHRTFDPLVSATIFEDTVIYILPLTCLI
jgi:hypothetical protein